MIISSINLGSLELLRRQIAARTGEDEKKSQDRLFDTILHPRILAVILEMATKNYPETGKEIL